MRYGGSYNYSRTGYNISRTFSRGSNDTDNICLWKNGMVDIMLVLKDEEAKAKAIMVHIYQVINAKKYQE